MCIMGRWWRGKASIGGIGCFRRSVLLSPREFTLLLSLFIFDVCCVVCCVLCLLCLLFVCWGGLH